MSATWSLLAKASNPNLGYCYYPAVWENSEKIYVKAQGEYDINTYTIATNSWSTLVTLPSNTDCHYFESSATNHELIWIANNKLYVWNQAGMWGGNTNYQIYMTSHNLSTGALVTAWTNGVSSVFGSVTYGTGHGNWGRNRHLQVVSDEVNNRIFLVNFYMKQICEFNASTETFTIVKTWSETVGGVSTDDVTGCNAVCVNGKIYIMGKHSYGASSGGIAGPLEIDIATWTATTKAAYPDYEGISTQTYKHYCDTQWVVIGNIIYGYGGRMQSTANADGSGTTQSAGNILRKVAFDTINNSWSDLGAIVDSYLYATTVGYNAVGFFIGGYVGGNATQVAYQLTYMPTPASGVNVAYVYSTKTLTVNWSYEDTNPDAFEIDYKKNTDTSWATEYLCGQIPGNARSIALCYMAAPCGGDSCYSITYTYDDTSTETVSYATSNFSLTSFSLESFKYLFRITPIVVV